MRVPDRLRTFLSPEGTARLDILRYLGPGLLVTVGFIDPGNWASNVAAGSMYGYSLLWIVTLSTLMLIVLQHNAAHLGIATGLCLSEAAVKHIRPLLGRSLLATAVAAAVATALAEIMGGAIALNMLFHIPLKLGAVMVAGVVVFFLSGTSYKRTEKWILGFVSLIGLAFVIELCLVKLEWRAATVSWVLPRIPAGAMPIVMSVLGAVVMPHNLFLHSEIIQSRQWNTKDDAIITRQLKYEGFDTLLSMVAGWAINSAMILVAAGAFYANHVEVTELDQAEKMLKPLLGQASALIFACALLVAGVASSVTAGMAGGSIVAGFFGEPYDIHDRHTRLGIAATIGLATVAVFFVGNPFKTLIYSQMALSIQLPLTIGLQIWLTSSRKVMGRYANDLTGSVLLWTIAAVVTALNIMLLVSFLR